MQRDKFYSITQGVGITAIFLILSLIKAFGDFSPFLLGFFVGLVYSKQNFLVTAPTYILASFVSNPTLESLVVSSTPVAVLAVVYFIHYKINRRVSLAVAVSCAFLGNIPSIVFMVLGAESLITIVSSVLVSILFAICAVIATYAILVRGIHAKFTLDEQISICAVLVVLSSGLYQIQVLGARPYFCIVAFCICIVVYALGSVGLVGAFVCATGGVFNGHLWVGISILAGASCVLAFRTVSPYVGAMGYMLASVGVGLYIGQVDNATLFVVSSLLGCAVFCLLPRGTKKRLGGLLTAFSTSHGGRHIVNRNRLELSNRLGALAKVFWELSSLVSDTGVDISQNERIERATKRVVGELCSNCPKRAKCDKIYLGDIEQLYLPIVECAYTKGRATLLELPPYITGSCIKVGEVIPLVNQITQNEVKRGQNANEDNAHKLFFAEQLISVGEMMTDMASKTRKSVGFNFQKERLLVDELAYLNILCSEAIIEDGGSVVLTIKDGESRRRGLEKVVSKIIGKKMRSKVERAVGVDGFDTVTLTPAPIYDMAFGEASSSKEGENKCGDSRLVLHPSVDNYVMMLADGMGSGARAEKSSSNAIGLIESFFKAGFDNKTIVNLVNKMLVTIGSDGYNTLDMCICNMKGECDFIKMGSCPSFIKSGDVIDILESSALPMGVIGEATPTIIKKSLTKNDIIVLVSDGVTDALGVDGVVDFLRETKVSNPQLLARQLHEKVVLRGKLDDVTVVVGKVFG